MEDREQTLREHAYRIWEEEGRIDGSHDDHWKRAEQQHELTEQESEDVTKANQQADDPFAREDGEAKPATGIRPPPIAGPV